MGWGAVQVGVWSSIGMGFTTLGGEAGAIAQPPPPPTTDLPAVCQFDSPRQPSLSLTLQFLQVDEANPRIQVKLITDRPTPDLQRFKRAIAQELNRSTLPKDLLDLSNQYAEATSTQKEDVRSRVRELVTTVFLNAGYITTEIPRDKLPTITPNQAIAVEIKLGQLRSMQPSKFDPKFSKNSQLHQMWLSAQKEYPFNSANQPDFVPLVVVSSPMARDWQIYVCERLRRGVGVPLNANDLEEQLRLLREDPAIQKIEAVLKKSEAGRCVGQAAGSNPSELNLSCLDVVVQPAPRLTGSVGLDNYSPPSVGSVRASADLRLRNPILVGDEFGIIYANSLTGGNELLEFNYRVPLNVLNGTVQLRAVPRNPSRITEQEFDLLQLRGTGELYEINYRQPIFRTPQRELALFTGFTAQNSRIFSEDPLIDRLFTPFVLGFEEGGISRTRVLKVGADYLTRTARSAVLGRVQLNFGTDWLGATTNRDPLPDGQFFSALIQGQWVQRIRRDIQFLVQTELQLTPDILLPSQQFAIGGGQSVRGYRQNAISGDNGFRLSLEPRFTLWSLEKAQEFRDRIGCLPGEIPQKPINVRTRFSTLMQSTNDPATGYDCEQRLDDISYFVGPFFDLGRVWNQPNPINPSTNTLLASVGVGFGVETGLSSGRRTPGFSIRLDFGLPLINRTTQGDDLQDIGLYFSFRYRF